MITLNSTIRELLETVQVNQPMQVGDFYKPGWWVTWSEAEQLNYIRDLGLNNIKLKGRALIRKT
ncbi:MAG: hypothetical protein HY870_23455 [Chloroflexi bacterium]|nr:hypothetical protein [Chloroflexota bacterium]